MSSIPLAVMLLSVVASCISPPSDPVTIVGDTINFDGPTHGVSNGTNPPPPRLKLRGRLPLELTGAWETPTLMTVKRLVITTRGRFRWTLYGCTGTVYWLGDARIDGDLLLLSPDKPDWLFGEGRMLRITKRDGDVLLYPIPRSQDDRSGDIPLERIVIDGGPNK